MADYAGVGSRIVAVIVDHIIVGIITAVIAIPMGLQMFAMSATGVMDPAVLFGQMMGMWGLSFVLWILYFSYFEGKSGQTLGKKVVNIKVTREDGKQPTFTDAVIRNVLRLIDMIGIYILGFILILATEKKQRIGDLAARTIVVKA